MIVAEAGRYRGRAIFESVHGERVVVDCNETDTFEDEAMQRAVEARFPESE